MTEDPIEIAWLAGLLEGEGCFRIDHRVAARRSAPGTRSQISVIVQMTDQDVMEHVNDLIGTGRPCARQLERRDPRWKSQWRVEVKGQLAEDVMRAVRPYMGDRRRAKIDECLSALNLSHHPRQV